MTDILKPCPLCGEELFHRVEPFADGSNPLHTAYCHCGFVFSDDCTNEEFIERCNRRRPDWTPCAEGKKLPEDGESVLVTQERFDGIRRTVAGHYNAFTGFFYGDAGTIMNVIAWQPLPEPYNPDQFREPTEMMQEKPNAHDKKVPPAKWCCGKPPIARYHESEIGLSRACHTIKCQVCHSGVQVDIENYTDEAYDAAFKHAVELWNETVQHRPPMNSDICIPRTEETT